MALIELSGIQKHYAMGDQVVKALDDVSLIIESNEFIGFIGASGSGKSTMVDLIPRFMDVDEGSISIDGKDISSLKLADLR